MKKTEREILELAAKAAGMAHMKYAGGSGLVRMLDPIRPETTGSIGPSWNPLEDDGDALRLAVKLRLTVMVWSDGGCASAAKTTPDGAAPSADGGWQAAFARGDIASATRRSIVHAAVVIGESMP